MRSQWKKNSPGEAAQPPRESWIMAAGSLCSTADGRTFAPRGGTGAFQPVAGELQRTALSGRI